jgi:hypothetical protein
LDLVTAPNNLKQAPHPSLITKEEMNLVEFPFSLPANRHPKDRDTIHVSINGTDSLQRPVNREWVVTGSQSMVFLGHRRGDSPGLFHPATGQLQERKSVPLASSNYSAGLLTHGPITGSNGYGPSPWVDQVPSDLLGQQGKCRHRRVRLVDSYRLWRRDSQSADHLLSRVTFSEFYDSILAGHQNP